jgi:hypothetical protein
MLVPIKKSKQFLVSLYLSRRLSGTFNLIGRWPAGNPPRQSAAGGFIRIRSS